LDALVIPEAEVSFEAGQKLEDLGAVWEVASLEDKHSLLLSMLDEVYLDLANTRSVVAIKPKPAFYLSYDSPGEKPHSTMRGFTDKALTNEPGFVSETKTGTVLGETGVGSSST
jgi:site-specific DNA recombinase